METTFSDLPDALVRDLLAAAVGVSEIVAARLGSMADSRERWRGKVSSAGLIRKKADLDVPRDPSVAALDGSYQIHRLTAIDLCACAAVAVEGIAKEEKRVWPEPYHDMAVHAVDHSMDATNALRGLMISMELGLALSAPHDLVLLDGSFAILVIYLNQGLTAGEDAPAAIREDLMRRVRESRLADRLVDLLGTDRYVAVPKYSSRNELANVLPEAGATDGRTIATLILEPGEYTAPLPIFTQEAGDRPYHLPDRFFMGGSSNEKLDAHLRDVRVVFFRPFGWAPALRLEVTGPASKSPNRLSMILTGIERQMFTPAVIEPYPLFLADRMVKSLGAGVQVVEQVVAQQTAATLTRPEDTILFLQNYRTEGGRA